MTKGIIYIMTTVVPGLVKIGKTQTENFSARMYQLERNGYANVVGLKRQFAIEVEDYEEKEKMLHDIFSKSNVPNTELFASDIDLVIQLLSSFEGRQIFPETKTKDEVFEQASGIGSGVSIIPDGKYTLERTVKGFGKVYGYGEVIGETFRVLRGSVCAPLKEKNAPNICLEANIINDILMEDVDCESPSTAGYIVIGKSNNGWECWRDVNGVPISYYRERKNM